MHELIKAQIKQDKNSFLLSEVEDLFGEVADILVSTVSVDNASVAPHSSSYKSKRKYVASRELIQNRASALVSSSERLTSINEEGIHAINLSVILLIVIYVMLYNSYYNSHFLHRIYYTVKKHME
jgi:hypothetical protein